MTVKFYVQAATPDKEVLQALFDNLDLLQQHQDLILSNPKYYNISIQGSGVFALYIPTFSLCLGELLLLWQHTPWKQEDTYFYCITGSPLSGSNTSRYWSKEQGLDIKILEQRARSGQQIYTDIRKATQLGDICPPHR